MATEIQRIEKAVDSFANAIKERLSQKMREGFTGWDDHDFSMENLVNRLFSKAKNINALPHDIGRKDLVDVAAFSMMLHLRQYKD